MLRQRLFVLAVSTVAGVVIGLSPTPAAAQHHSSAGGGGGGFHGGGSSYRGSSFAGGSSSHGGSSFAGGSNSHSGGAPMGGAPLGPVHTSVPAGGIPPGQHVEVHHGGIPEHGGRFLGDWHDRYHPLPGYGAYPFWGVDFGLGFGLGLASPWYYGDYSPLDYSDFYVNPSDIGYSISPYDYFSGSPSPVTNPAVPSLADLGNSSQQVATDDTVHVRSARAGRCGGLV